MMLFAYVICVFVSLFCTFSTFFLCCHLSNTDEYISRLQFEPDFKGWFFWACILIAGTYKNFDKGLYVNWHFDWLMDGWMVGWIDGWMDRSLLFPDWEWVWQLPIGEVWPSVHGSFARHLHTTPRRRCRQRQRRRAVYHRRKCRELPAVWRSWRCLRNCWLRSYCK